uniref:Retrovirus-related Pol polyprotein from transposon TNT 1-94-like beta-barrel domain-containing protein n=1 Tax=Utricularia reniformis TaxID=192314 RepID=A0A1Y0B438_9LAMI|nr:hypothetical protein AEK19_MT2022 [Utricularia reniformis]ART32181.1 hypothetical protein AEK19_MT2022 [Utricularia reniformis]
MNVNNVSTTAKQPDAKALILLLDLPMGMHMVKVFCHSLLIQLILHLTHMIRVIDSGATDHMCLNLELFDQVYDVSGIEINLPNGSQALSCHIGSVKVSPTWKECFMFPRSNRILSLLGSDSWLLSHPWEFRHVR